MFVKAIKLLRSPLQAYRDYASRNWPTWWSLKLGMPLGYAFAIVVLTSIIGLMANVGDLKTVDRQLMEQYGRCEKNCFSLPREESGKCLNNCLPAESKSILDRAKQLIWSLTALPLVIGTLFSFLWFFYIARSLKFTNAPLLGHQPGVLPLMLVGCGLLWAGLAGLKLFQWTNYSIGFLDFTAFGSESILPGAPSDTNDDYRGYSTAFRGQSAALIGLMISSIFVSYGAVFLVLLRQMGIGAALSGLVFKILALGLSVAIVATFEVEMKSGLVPALVIAVPLLIPPLIGLYTLFSGHRVRRLSMLGISTLLYLLSFGPMWLYLTLGLSQIPSAALAFFKDKEIILYFLCFGASVIGCEVLVNRLYRKRLRPA